MIEIKVFKLYLNTMESICICIPDQSICNCICIWKIVTGFMKTSPNHTRTEIHLLPNIKATLWHCPDVPSTWLKMAKSSFTEGFLQTL